MQAIGDALKSERLKKGLSLDDVCEITKITAANLDALENELFDRFPNKVYARAYLRDYSNFLQLDTDELLEMYEASLKKDEPEIEEQPFFVRYRVFLGFASVLVILIIVFIAIFANKPHTAETVRKAQPAHVEEPAVKEAPKAVAVQEVVLTLEIKNDVWVDVRPYGGEAFVGTLKAGEKKTFSSAKKIYIRIAKPQAAVITLNGVKKDLGTVPVTKVFLLENITHYTK